MYLCVKDLYPQSLLIYILVQIWFHIPSLCGQCLHSFGCVWVTLLGISFSSDLRTRDNSVLVPMLIASLCLASSHKYRCETEIKTGRFQVSLCISMPCVDWEHLVGVGGGEILFRLFKKNFCFFFVFYHTVIGLWCFLCVCVYACIYFVFFSWGREICVKARVGRFFFEFKC